MVPNDSRAVSTFSAGGVPDSAVSSFNQHIFILNFHGIGSPKRRLPSSEERVWLEEARFAAILDYATTRNDVILTFDDANESDFTIALPHLRARGMKAQFFLVAQRIDQAGCLSAKQVQSLSAEGMGIGNHGMCHRRWTELDASQLHEELIEARSSLQQLTGVGIVEAACPFGSYNRRVVQSLRGAGYQRIYTSDGGPANPGAWLQPRSSVYRTDSLDDIRRKLADQMSVAQRIWRRAKLFYKRWR